MSEGRSEHDLAKTKEELIAELKQIDRHLTIDELIDILGSTIKHDNENKVITFLTMLNTYSQEDQINIGFLAESSTGKSYIPLELAKYFLQDDIVMLGYASPTAFFHEYGELITDPTDNRDIPEEKKRKTRRIDLHQKIIIFLDQPHDQLLQRLRSLLSHDEKEIVLKITDKAERFGLRTKNVIVVGFPTVIFCSAKFTMQDQEKTRLLLLSPEVSQEKLRESIALKIQKESDREAYEKTFQENPQYKDVCTRVWSIKRAHLKGAKIPEELREKIYERFLEDHKKLNPRHQRDISRLLAIMKGYALLNHKDHEKIDDHIIITLEDVEAGFKLYYAVSEANEYGLSPEIYRIYQKLKLFLEDKENGTTRKEFQAWYYKTFFKIIGRDRATDILKILDSVGLIIEQPDPVDRKLLRYVLPDMGTTSESVAPDVYPPSATQTTIEKKETS
jgi:hypothetical protein